MIVIHQKILLKVNSDDVAVPNAINVLAVRCLVYTSLFMVIDLIIILLCSFLFFVLDISSVFPMMQIYWKLLQWNQYCNIFIKMWHSKLFIHGKELASCIIHIFKVVSGSSYECILIFWCVILIFIAYYIEIDSCGKLFVAWKIIYKRVFFLMID